LRSIGPAPNKALTLESGDPCSIGKRLFALGGLALGAALLSHGLRKRRAMDFSGRTVLITGGSRGLGLLIARELGRLGARVVLVARDGQALASAREE
jgi:NADPH:quinone reductase-like Zn-dependent oxidoreductase